MMFFVLLIIMDSQKAGGRKKQNRKEWENSMNELQIFRNEKFGEVRTIEEQGKILFCGSDVATALGYSNPRDALRRHCKGVVKHDTLTRGGSQQISFIPEGDIYRLAAKSELPGAEEFESWIFDEVLPSIRKHGAYMTPQTLEQAILNPDTIIKIATALKEEQDKNKALQAVNSSLTVDNTIMKPKAEYFDELVDRNLLTNIRETSKELQRNLSLFCWNENMCTEIRGGSLRHMLSL